MGDAIGADFTPVGQTEVSTSGGRRIDVVAKMEDGVEFVIERYRMYAGMAALETRDPSRGGHRTVVGLQEDVSDSAPISSYAMSISGIPVDALSTPDYRSAADALFGFNGSETRGQTGYRLADAGPD